MLSEHTIKPHRFSLRENSGARFYIYSSYLGLSFGREAIDERATEKNRISRRDFHSPTPPDPPRWSSSFNLKGGTAHWRPYRTPYRRVIYYCRHGEYIKFPLPSLARARREFDS